MTLPSTFCVRYESSHPRANEFEQWYYDRYPKANNWPMPTDIDMFFGVPENKDDWCISSIQLDYKNQYSIDQFFALLKPMERIEITGQPEPLSAIERLKEELRENFEYSDSWAYIQDILGRY